MAHRPVSTGRSKRGSSARGTTTTGHAACWAQRWPTDPSIARAKPPRPRRPTTRSSAPSEAWIRASDGSPSTRCSLSRAGRSPGKTEPNSTAKRSRACCRSKSGSVAGPLQPAADGVSQTWIASTTPPMVRAYRSAHRSAAYDVGDPSTPTTTRGTESEDCMVTSLSSRRSPAVIVSACPRCRALHRRASRGAVRRSATMVTRTRGIRGADWVKRAVSVRGSCLPVDAARRRGGQGPCDLLNRAGRPCFHRPDVRGWMCREALPPQVRTP